MADTLHKLGFVGFGAMPLRMARRLRAEGRSVVAFDPGQDGGELDGFPLVDGAAALAGQVDAVLVCVPNDAALHEATQGPGGVLEAAREQQLLVNFSTVSPTASQALSKAAKAKGVRYVETPMSGSTPEAETGKLVFLAGGDAADVAAAEDVLRILGRRTVHVGAVGTGAVTKLIINGVMALGTAALAEGLAYGARAELDRDVLIDVLSDLILVSEHHKRKLGMAREGKYPAQFPTHLMSKDMGLLLADARERGAPMPTMAAAAQLYAFADRAHAEEDYASAIAAMEAAARG